MCAENSQFVSGYRVKIIEEGIPINDFEISKVSWVKYNLTLGHVTWIDFEISKVSWVKYNLTLGHMTWIDFEISKVSWVKCNLALGHVTLGHVTLGHVTWCLMYQGSSQEISPTDAGSGVFPSGGHWGGIPMWLRTGQLMAVHPNRQPVGWAGAGYIPVYSDISPYAWKSVCILCLVTSVWKSVCILCLVTSVWKSVCNLCLVISVV